jgi:DNA-binding response OmpR family regulator
MKHRKSAGRILVVEDELILAKGMTMILEDAGYVVVGPFGRVEQALKAARYDKIDLALLDVNVRGEKVYPIADVLADRGIPFAFLTGYHKDSLSSNHITAAVLVKPFGVAELLASVNNWLAKTDE